jgi:hypothetical protein
MDLNESIEIAARPERVFSVLSDLPGMGSLSPENTGGQWLDGTFTAHLGARFRGTNEQDGDEWSTVAKVTVFEPPTSFAFEVTWHRFRISRWEYHVETTSTGCRVTESWTDRRNAVIRRDGDTETFKRVEFTKESIHTTLVALKKICESTPA